MFCPKCGAESAIGRFCRSCGTNLETVSDIIGEPIPRTVNSGAPGADFTLALFQQQSLSNARIGPKGHNAVAVFGGLTLDLTADPLPAGETRIAVVAVFASAEVLVPDDVAVRVTGFSLFGNVNAFGESLGNGIMNVNDYESPGYEQAERRVQLDVTSIFSGVRLR